MSTGSGRGQLRAILRPAPGGGLAGFVAPGYVHSRGKWPTLSQRPGGSLLATPTLPPSLCLAWRGGALVALWWRLGGVLVAMADDNNAPAAGQVVIRKSNNK